MATNLILTLIPNWMKCSQIVGVDCPSVQSFAVAEMHIECANDYKLIKQKITWWKKGPQSQCDFTPTWNTYLLFFSTPPPFPPQHVSNWCPSSNYIYLLLTHFVGIENQFCIRMFVFFSSSLFFGRTDFFTCHCWLFLLLVQRFIRKCDCIFNVFYLAIVSSK